MRAASVRIKRGRPPKFGRPGQVVALTLPAEVVRGLRRLHPDLAWAIVTLFEQAVGRRCAPARAAAAGDVELLTAGARRSLIVVNPDVFGSLGSVNVVPLDRDRALLALDPGCGMSDLELAVIDRLALPSIGGRERRALNALRTRLRKWRSDPSLRCEARAIILLERAGASRGTGKRVRRPRSS